jgi:tetratricopeptide (TPR) repeat protein
MKHTTLHIALFIGLVAGMFTGCLSSREPDPRAVSGYAEVRELYVQGEEEQAFTKARLLHEDYPEYPPLQFILGKLLYLKGSPDKPKEQLQPLVRKDPHYIDAVKWLSRLYLDKHLAGEAELILLKALEYSSEDPELLMLMGKSRTMQDDFANALLFFRTSESYHERFAETHLELATLYKSAGRNELALSSLKKALAILPRNSPLRNPLTDLISQERAKQTGTSGE